MMTYEQAYSSFCSIEQNENLQDFIIQDFRIWDALRFPLWNMILNHHRIMDIPRQKTEGHNHFSKLRLLSRSLYYSLRKSPLFCREAQYLFLGSPRRRLIDNYHYDIYCDFLIEHLGQENCLVLESAFKEHHFQPPRTKRIVYTDLLDLFKSSFVSDNFYSNMDKIVINDIMEIFGEQFGIDRSNILNSINMLMTTRKRIHKYFKIIITRINPKVVFIVCSYGKEFYIEVCNLLNIPTVELQHGVISPYHFGYNFPRIGYKKTFPKYFFSFGDYWNFVDLPIQKDKVIAIGFPFFSFQKKLFSNFRPKYNQILFVSQGTISKKLFEFACDLSQLLGESYSILYKLHPGEKHFPNNRAQLNKQISIINSEPPVLYQLIAESILVIGVYSTVMFESIGMQRQTVIVRLPGWQSMRGLKNCKFCYFVDNCDEVKSLLLGIQEDLCKDDFSNKLFASSWKTNLNGALKRIVQEN